MRLAVQDFSDPIYRKVDHKLRPILDGFVSTAVEVFCRAVLLEYHKPQDQRYILTSTCLNHFILDYLYRLLVILDPSRRKVDKGQYLVVQQGIESRSFHKTWGTYRPSYEGKSFWCREVTATTHHQINLVYWENIILYLLALNFLEFDHLEAQLRFMLVQFHGKGFVILVTVDLKMIGCLHYSTT